MGGTSRIIDGFDRSGMIHSITIKSREPFVDEVRIENCGIINYIFGANGTGKTTIGRFLENPDDPSFSESQIIWDSEHADVYVYNKAFRDSYVRQEMPGIFTLGSGNVEAFQQIADLKELLGIKKTELERTIDLRERKTDELETECSFFKERAWKNIYTPIKEVFSEALVGFKTKERFAQLLLTTEYLKDSLSYDELAKKAAVLFGQKPEIIPSIESVVEEIETSLCSLHQTCSSALWKTPIVGNAQLPIAQLINRLDNSAWVAKGREYIEDDICPFCQERTLTPALKKQIEDFFDDTYESQITALKQLRLQYLDCIGTCERAVTHIVDAASSIDGEFESLALSLRETWVECALAAEKDLQAINRKSEDPCLRIEVKGLGESEEALRERIEAICGLIAHRNNVVADYDAQKRKLVFEIKQYLCANHSYEVEQYKKIRTDLEKAVSGLGNSIDKQREEIRALEDKMGMLNTQITSVRPSVDSINQILKAYGFTGFYLECVNDSTYQVMRPNGIAAGESLSEGEETFVSFLYYSQLAAGAFEPSQASSSRVLVIDDPVSSLDDNVLYVVSSIVKALLNEAANSNGMIKQVFVFTHNTHFFREVSSNLSRGITQKGIQRFWLLQKQGENASIKSCNANPIRNSYQMLWDDLKRYRSESSTMSSGVCNTMRRILEYYFGLTGQQWETSILESFETGEERMVCSSLLSFVNDGSHAVFDELYVDQYYPDDLLRYFSVFESIFSATNQIEHYRMMMGEDEPN